MQTVAFYTLGCKVNQYETESLREKFIKNNYEICDFDSVCDIYIINSCTVTSTSDKKSRQAVSRAKRLNPKAIIALIGCYAQHLSDQDKEAIGASIYLGTNDKGKLFDLISSHQNSNRLDAVSDVSTCDRYTETPVMGTHTDRLRGYIKIEDGCNRFCSYCIIPYVRGRVRSRSLENITREAEALAQNGLHEIVLTGIQTGAYGTDFTDQSISLIDAIEAAAKPIGVKRIRLSSLDPNTITEDFLKRCLETNKFCCHFHLSLQSGCNKILKSMNRKYTAEDYYEKTVLIRKFFPNAAITTDIIAGFPGETEEDFQQTLQFAEKCRLSKIHAFPYSPREGTKAAKMPDLPPKSVRNSRTKQLIALSEQLRGEFLREIQNTPQMVYFEKKDDRDTYYGYTENYVYVQKKSKHNLLGKVCALQLTPTCIASETAEDA